MAKRRAKVRRPRKMSLRVPKLAIPPLAFVLTALASLGLCLAGLLSVGAAALIIATCLALAPLSAVAYLIYKALKRRRCIVVVWH